MGAVKEAMLARRSMSRVTDAAPTRAQLRELVEAAGQVADHSGLRPWRIIELRGDDRDVLGRALAKADGRSKKDAVKHVAKARRAPLVLAIVGSYRRSKVARWEQEAVASGVAHALSLVLHDEGWGVFWRTGSTTRHKAVRKAHRLDKDEELLGWLYVGGIPETGRRPRPRNRIRVERHLSTL